MDSILLCIKANQIVLKDILPVGIAVFVFIANVFYQREIKRNNIRDKISSEVISTCDKMIRYAVETEYSTLTWKYWNRILQLYPLDKDENKENNKSAINESNYYHRKTEDAGLKLDLLKSELKKSTRDLQKYWHNEFEAKRIISLMSSAVLKEPRRFDKELIKKYNSREEIVKEYNDLIREVQNEIVFEGMGFDLIRIQKLIDLDSPTLLLSDELEKELIEKIKACSTN